MQAKTSCPNKSEGHCRWWDPKVSITWHFNRKLSALFSYLNLYPSIMKLLQMLPTITVFSTEMPFVWVLTFLCTIFYFQQLASKCTYISMLYYYREEAMLIVYFYVKLKKNRDLLIKYTKDVLRHIWLMIRYFSLKTHLLQITHYLLKTTRQREQIPCKLRNRASIIAWKYTTVWMDISVGRFTSKPSKPDAL